MKSVLEMNLASHDGIWIIYPFRSSLFITSITCVIVLLLTGDSLRFVMFLHRD